MKNVLIKIVPLECRIFNMIIILIITLIVTSIIALIAPNPLLSQTPASPSNWMYPDGNMNATKYNKYPSTKEQKFENIKIKWFTNSIRGDVQPLIGNIVNNSPIIDNSELFPFAPNEIAAVIGDSLFIFDGAGKLLANLHLEQDLRITGIIGVSALLDTSATTYSPEDSKRTLVLGFETIESKIEGNTAVCYLGGWKTNGKFGLVKKLGINLIKSTEQQTYDYFPNASASLKPVYARQRTNESGYVIFATVNMSQPKEGSNWPDNLIYDEWGNPYRTPYFRGLTSFRIEGGENLTVVEGDEFQYRLHLAPQVNFAQPSISKIFNNSTNNILLPCLPNIVGNNNPIANSQIPNIETLPEQSYLFNFKLERNGFIDQMEDGISDFVLVSEVDSSARIRAYFMDLNNGENYTQTYILMTTEYSGVGKPKSSGRAGLFMFDATSDRLYTTDPEYYDYERSPFYGGRNHYWSVAVGDVDGKNMSNSLGIYYPNNRGNEIIVTQSTRKFAYPNSRLMILRYNDNEPPTPKASSPGENLNYLDTICSGNIQGWVAAVNDIDGIDGKDEILVVDGSDIFVLRMCDYASVEFQNGKYFDTVFTYNFLNQTVMSAAVADVDGDGKNEIIVTTNEGMFVLGAPLERTIIMIGLKENYQSDWCFGDTVKVTWKNVIVGDGRVNILFQKTKNGVIMPDSIIVLQSNYLNNRDTMVYNLVINSNIIGIEGRIIIQNIVNPEINADTTGLLRFHKPMIASSNIGFIDTIYSGAKVTITGQASCTDSIKLYYSFDQKNWILVGKTEVEPNTDTFNLTSEIPCMPFFECRTNKVDSLIFGKMIFSRYSSQDSTEIFPLVIRPAILPITIDPCDYACASRVFRWQLLDTTARGLMNVLMSKDDGKTFEYLGSTLINSSYYVWDVPANVTNPVHVRLCSDMYCYQADTTFWNFQPRYIRTVAPNPLRIPYEAEIIYQVDDDVNVTIRILDQSNRYVKEVVKNLPRKGGFIYCDYWDGRLEDKTPVANGMYYILLEFSNGLKEVYPIYIRN